MQKYTNKMYKICHTTLKYAKVQEKCIKYAKII